MFVDSGHDDQDTPKMQIKLLKLLLTLNLSYNSQDCKLKTIKTNRIL